jgi:hypothetical protein
MARLTARERALPGMREEAQRRLQVLNDCPEDEVDAAANDLAGAVKPDVQPDWDACPVGRKRFDRAGFAWKRDLPVQAG